MKALIQRVAKASVSVDREKIAEIDGGLLVLLGVVKGDTRAKAELLSKKCVELRIFEDDAGKMNRSLADIDGGMLIVSQFTLAANCRKGRRPSFDDAAPPDLAEELYEKFCTLCRDEGIRVQTGKFAAFMQVELINDGPVTIMLDSDSI